MNANEIIAKAGALCRDLGQPVPPELKPYVWDWQRQRYDLVWCWWRVKSALIERKAMCHVEAEVRSHYAGLQAARDRQEAERGKPLSCPFPMPEGLPWAAAAPLPTLTAPNSAQDPLRRWPRVRPAPATSEQPPAGGPPKASRRGLTKANRVRALLASHVVRRGPIAVTKLENIAKAEGLLRQDQEISRCSTFRRAMKELDIESHRVGYGPGGYYVWRLRPPAWSISDQERELGNGRP